jgi:acetoin utilization protein AcuC
MGLLSGPNISEAAPEPAQREILEKFHSARYLDALHQASQGEAGLELLYMGIGTGDCPIFPDMYDYSVLACGATLKAANLILAGSANVAFNPSGGYHHAGPESAAGFCYINDVAIGCLTLAEAGKRVLYLDIDVHYSDGVANAFYDRKDVMTISFHQSGRTLFPGTGFEDEIGEGDGKGYCVNVPLPVGTYDEAYKKAFDALAIPLITAYAPDVIVLEFGADALAGDPLAHLRLTNNAYADIIASLLTFHKPILMTGGGGYHIENTVRAWALGWSVLCGADDPNAHANIGMGGVMLESTDWLGGLRDRHLPVTREQREAVLPAIDTSIEAIKTNVFPLHGL